MEALVELPGRRPQDGERRARPRARRSRAAGRSPRAARVEPHRHRRGRRSGRRRAAVVRRDAARAVDAHVRHADPARPPHLPAEAAVRPVRRARRLRLLPHSSSRGSADRKREGRSRKAQTRNSQNRKARWNEARSNSSSLRRSRSIPTRFRDAMQNIAIVVEDEPSAELLHEMDIEPPDTLLGLYQGTPLTERALGLRQRAARSHPDLPGSARARRRRRGRPGRRDRRDADPRDRPLLRAERGRDRGDRRAVLAGRMTRSVSPGARRRKRFGQHFLEPAWVDKVDPRDRSAAGSDVHRDRTGPRRADPPARRARRSRSRPSKSIATSPPSCGDERHPEPDGRRGRLSCEVDGCG